MIQHQNTSFGNEFFFLKYPFRCYLIINNKKNNNSQSLSFQRVGVGYMEQKYRTYMIILGCQTVFSHVTHLNRDAETKNMCHTNFLHFGSSNVALCYQGFIVMIKHGPTILSVI